MKRFGVLVAVGVLFAAAPSFAQTVGTCPRGGGGNQPPPVTGPVRSRQRPDHAADDKPMIAQAVKTAKDRGRCRPSA